LITGEAGVGKSRFLQEFLEGIQTSGPDIIRFQCSPFHANTAFHPIIGWLTSLAALKEDDSVETRLKRLDQLVHEAPRSRSESIQLMATLLNMDIGEELPPKLRDSPPLRLAAIHEMLIEQILARADHASVAVIFEDAHWIDPTTLECVKQISQACKNRRLLVLATSRPDITIEHVLRKRMHSINLGGLSMKETEELIRSVHQGHSMSATALKAVVERTDGVPLFIEELTKLVIEQADEFADSESNIPTTLVDSLTARLDRLGTAKSVAQIGATIGREFSYDLLRLVDPRDEATLKDDLKRLVDAELLHFVETGESRSYRFKHALVQDAAYDTLLYSNRREYHYRIAETLLEVFPETVQNSPEIIAHHLGEGGRGLEAVDYWKAAGLNATSRSANMEAIHHLSMGIEALNSLSSLSPNLLKKELELQIALGPPLVAARGYASNELETAFSRALEIDDLLSEGINDFHALWGLSSFYLIRGQLQQSRDLLTVCHELAEKEGNQDWIVLVSSWLGTVLFYSSEFTRAEELLREAIQGYQPESAVRLGLQFGLDPAVLARVHLVWLHWLRGENDKANKLDLETLAFSRTLDHPLSQVHSLNFSVVLQVFLGDYEKALERAERLMSLASEFEFPHYIAYARIMRGFAKAKLGSVNRGIDEMVNGLKARRDTGAELVRPMFLTMLAEVLLDADQLSWGLETLDEVNSIIANNNERWLESESQRMRGLVLEQQNPGNKEAVICLKKALKTARAFGSVNLEIRVLVSLIKLKKQYAHHDNQSSDLLTRLANLHEGLPEEISSIDRQQSYELLAAHGFY
jgi:predicted ATPase